MSEHADAGSLADRLETLDARLKGWIDAPTLREAASVLRALAGTRETAQPYPPDDVYVPKATVTWGDVRAAQAAPSEPDDKPSVEHDGESPETTASGSLGAAALPPRDLTPEKRKEIDAMLRERYGDDYATANLERYERPAISRAALPPDAHAAAEDDVLQAMDAMRFERCNGCQRPRSQWGPICDGMTQGDFTHYHSPEFWQAKGRNALARLVAALPGAPAETHTAPGTQR